MIAVLPSHFASSELTRMLYEERNSLYPTGIPLGVAGHLGHADRMPRTKPGPSTQSQYVTNRDQVSGKGDSCCPTQQFRPHHGTEKLFFVYATEKPEKIYVPYESSRMRRKEKHKRKIQMSLTLVCTCTRHRAMRWQIANPSRSSTSAVAKPHTVSIAATPHYSGQRQ